MVITLLTDFGLADTYVGQMKGAILAIAPDASVVDLTHAVPPQDVRAGAFLLWSAVEAFPAHTIHVAVVDPGVGSPRRGIAIQSTRGDVLIGPDNGLLIPAAERLGGVQITVELTPPAGASTTFHGRDVFAPAAARLAAGAHLEELGPTISQVYHLGFLASRGSSGEVVHVDTYGNLITNVPRENLPQDYEVEIGAWVAPKAAYYAAVAPGELLALVGSSGLLEISARDANAAQITRTRRGSPVTIRPRQLPPG